MSSPAVGFATRNLAGPIGAGQRGRFSVPRRFVPLSQFFLTTDKPEKGERVIYGREEPPKKKTPKGTKKSVPASDAPTAPQDEGITTTANVPTVPVPLGGKLDRADDEKKKRKKRKDLPTRMTLLLRRLF